MEQLFYTNKIHAGQIKKHQEEIQNKSKTKLNIVQNKIEVSARDASDLYFFETFIEAINLGYDIKDSLKLFEENYQLETIYIKDFHVRSPSDLKRIKARLIGRQGKIKQDFEKTTNTKIKVQNKTVTILGTIQEVRAARLALTRLMSGSKIDKALSFAQDRIEKSEFDDWK